MLGVMAVALVKAGPVSPTTPNPTPHTQSAGPTRLSLARSENSLGTVSKAACLQPAGWVGEIRQGTTVSRMLECRAGQDRGKRR